MKSILSTKILKPNQRDLLLGQGFTLVAYNAIEIEFLEFEKPKHIKNTIFTSQNGVKSILNSEVAIENCFCVGQKTKTLLEENNLNVVKMSDNSAELGQFIAKNCKKSSFYYFCGTQRRDELPELLKASKINFFEVKTYKTILKPKKFKQEWDGILFFSPSGVESFMLENKINEAVAFCIGETTADVARKYYNNVIVANSTLVESVIAKVVKTFKKNSK